MNVITSQILYFQLKIEIHHGTYGDYGFWWALRNNSFSSFIYMRKRKTLGKLKVKLKIVFGMNIRLNQLGCKYKTKLKLNKCL